MKRTSPRVVPKQARLDDQGGERESIVPPKVGRRVVGGQQVVIDGRVPRDTGTQSPVAPAIKPRPRPDRRASRARPFPLN